MLSVSADNRTYCIYPLQSVNPILPPFVIAGTQIPQLHGRLPLFRFQQICSPSDQKLLILLSFLPGWKLNLKLHWRWPSTHLNSITSLCLLSLFLLSLFVRGSFYSPTWIYEEYIKLEFGTGLYSVTIMCTTNSTSKGAHWQWQFIHFPWSKITSSKPPGKKKYPIT